MTKYSTFTYSESIIAHRIYASYYLRSSLSPKKSMYSIKKCEKTLAQNIAKLISITESRSKEKNRINK